MAGLPPRWSLPLLPPPRGSSSTTSAPLQPGLALLPPLLDRAAGLPAQETERRRGRGGRAEDADGKRKLQRRRRRPAAVGVPALDRHPGDPPRASLAAPPVPPRGPELDSRLPRPLRLPFATARAAAAALGRGARRRCSSAGSEAIPSSCRRASAGSVGQLVPRAADRARADAAAVSAALAAQARREALAKSRRQQRAREKEEQKARRGDAVADVSLASSEGDDDGEEEGDEAIEEEEEEEEEERTQQSASVIRIEQFGMKLAHQFPWAPSAAVAVGLALRRRFLSDPDAPSTATRRRQITSTLRRGVLAGADSAAGWKALAELQYQNRDFAAAPTQPPAGSSGPSAGAPRATRRSPVSRSRCGCAWRARCAGWAGSTRPRPRCACWPAGSRRASARSTGCRARRPCRSGSRPCAGWPRSRSRAGTGRVQGDVRARAGQGADRPRGAGGALVSWRGFFSFVFRASEAKQSAREEVASFRPFLIAQKN